PTINILDTMNINEVHKYFDRKPMKWNIREFLDECGEETFQRKIEVYLLSLETIADSLESEKGPRYDMAKKLLAKYKASIRAFLERKEISSVVEICGFSIIQVCGTCTTEAPGELRAHLMLSLRGDLVDRSEARNWVESYECKPASKPIIHLHSSTITGSTINSLINSGTVNNSKRKQEESDDDFQPVMPIREKRKKQLSLPKKVAIMNKGSVSSKQAKTKEKGDDYTERSMSFDHNDVQPSQSTDSTSMSSTTTQAKNVDSCEDDELDYNNHEIDQNIELERQLSFQKHIKKYPDEDSPSDVWLLPSGKSINEVIRGPENLHKSQKSKWIEQDDWNYLNSSIEYPHCNLSSEAENLFTTLLETMSYYGCKYFDFAEFLSKNRGEVHLKASANQRFVRRNLKPEDDKPKGMKVDGSFQSPDNKGLEIAKKFNHGDYKVLRRLRTWFFHIHGLEVQIWGMDLPVSKAYRMFLIGVFRLPINWDEHHELVYALKILWNLGVKVFEKETDVIINCSELGAKELVEDDEKNKLFPIGGQPIGFKFKRNEGQKTCFITCTKDENEEKYEAILVTQEIIQGCKEVRPNLFMKELEIVAKKRRLRPYREGGIRIELKPFGDKGWICYNYGYSGQGFQFSYSSAKELIKILHEKNILS
ncbi:6157_t:CDS:10, partial [Funneliformis geosporum]